MFHQQQVTALREADRQTERETERQMGRQAERERERERDIWTGKVTEGEKESDILDGL